MLGFIAWLSYRELRKAVSIKFGSRAGIFFGFLLCLQFHFPFYCSRSLPNTFALILLMLSYSMWLNGHCSSSLYTIAVAMVVFRCDMVMMLGPMALQMLWLREVQFLSIVISGFIVSITVLGISVIIDSYFWGQWLYPEGIVLLFNTIENKSSEWGTMPWHW